MGGWINENIVCRQETIMSNVNVTQQNLVNGKSLSYCFQGIYQNNYFWDLKMEKYKYILKCQNGMLS